MEHGRGTVTAACERSGTGTDKAAHANAAHQCLPALTDYVKKLLGYLIHCVHRMPEVIGAAIRLRADAFELEQLLHGVLQACWRPGASKPHVCAPFARAASA